MRINFTLWSVGLAGGVRAIFEIANRLSEKGHHITITALGGDYRWFSLNTNVKVNYTKLPNVFQILNPIFKIKYKRCMNYLDINLIFDKLKKLGVDLELDFIKPLYKTVPECDINVATWYPTAFAVYRSGKGVPFYFFQDFEELVKSSGHYYLRMFKESLYLPLNIITGSQWLRKWIRQNYGKDATVVGYGINHDVFYPRENILTDVYGLKIMGIFRGLAYKGDKDLIEALNIVSQKIPNITLIAVSSKEIFLKMLNKNTCKFNYILFDRPDDDKMAQLYSSADVFVFPSHVEGFGLPPLEAMACGTPVVTTDCLGVRDYVVNGKNAIVVPPQNPNALADAVINVLTNKMLAKKLRDNGLKTAKAFTWDKVTEKIENIFLKSLEERNLL